MSLSFFSCSITQPLDSTSSSSTPSHYIELTSPINNGVGIDAASGTLNFEWKSTFANASYELLVSKQNPPVIADSIATTLTNTSYEYIKDLDLNTPYYWQVIVRKADGSTTKSSVYSFTTDNGLSVVALPNADSVAIGTQTFSWMVSNNITKSEYKFYIYISDTKDFTNPTPIEITSTNKATLDIDISNLPGLAPNKQYFWKLKAEHQTDTSKSAESEVLHFFTESISRAIYLTSPANHKADQSVGVVNFNWDIDTSFAGATTYKILLDESNPPTTEKNTLLTNKTFNFTTAGTDFRKTYYWKVIATNNGVDYESAVFQFTNESGIGFANNTIADADLGIDISSINFAWILPISFQSSGAATTDLYLYKKGQPEAKVGTVSNSAETYTFTGVLDFATEYAWRLVSTNNGITSSTEVRNFTTELGASLSSPTHELQEQNISNLTFEWNLSQSLAGAQSTLYFDTNPNPTTEIVSNLSVTRYSYADYLQFGNTYYWKVVSSNSSYSSTSPVYSFTTKIANINITGFVSTSQGGAGVDGSTVTLESTDANATFATTTTASDGSFSLMGIEGEFSLVARKSGRATSKVETYITEDMPNLSLQQFPIVYAGRSLIPPDIRVYDNSGSVFANNSSIGPNKDNIILQYEVTASNALTPTSNRSSVVISIFNPNINQREHYPLTIYNTYSNSIPKTPIEIETRDFPPGKSYLEFKSYDNNNNQTKKIIPVVNVLEIDEMEDGPILMKVGTPGTGVLFSATTLGKERGYYSVQANTTAYVDIKVQSSDWDNIYYGVMIYRGTSEDNVKYIGSTTDRQYLSGTGNKFYVYRDASPELSERTVYVYKFKVFKESYLYEKVYLSEMSEAFRVPILPRYGLSLVSPAHGDILTAPSSIEFKWQVGLGSLDFIVNDPSYNGSTITRYDNLYLYEEGNSLPFYSKSLESTGTNVGLGEYSYLYDLSILPTPLKNTQLFWELSSVISYLKQVDTDNLVYEVRSTSSPSGSKNPSFSNVSQQGVAYFFVK